MFDGIKEWAGKFVSKIPTKSAQGLARTIDPELNEHKYEDSVLIKGAGAAGCGLLGYMLGSNFGTFGKLVGGIVGVWGGWKLTKEVATDVGAAQDYCAKNKGANFFKAFGANTLTIGHKYDGTTTDVEPDV